VSGPVLVACDLDRTLVYSRAACQLPPGEHPALVCVERIDGAEQSFMTADAVAGFADLTARAVVVPTTTRTREQMERIVLPGRPARYAIAANGGVLLQDGAVDEDWTRSVTASLAASCAPLAEVWERVERVFDAPWALRRRVAADLFCYAVVERDRMPAGVVADLVVWSAERGWGVSVQGRKVYVVPSVLTKRAAVDEVASRTGARRVLAAGDSLLDQEMLEGADAAARPPHGELEAAGFRAPHLDVLPRAGVLAGEDLVRWFLGRTGS
jgi:phosphoserine phosphatase